ncbi:hypothetical protein FKM82_024926 [Ascaphus truei]
MQSRENSKRCNAEEDQGHFGKRFPVTGYKADERLSLIINCPTVERREWGPPGARETGGEQLLRRGCSTKHGLVHPHAWKMELLCLLATKAFALTSDGGGIFRSPHVSGHVSIGLQS